MNKFLFAIRLCGLSIIAVFASCNKDHTNSNKASTINVGSVLPLTGSAAVWGQNARMGMELALRQINANGGIASRQISISYEDSQSDPKTATSALQKLIAANSVQVVIGDIASSSVLAMAPIAERNKVVLLSPGASNPEISHAGEFIFRNWQSDALEGTVDARYAFSTLGWKRVACLSVNNAYGSGLEGVFVATFRSLGGEIVAEESFQQGAVDLRAQVVRIAAIKADGLYMPGYPPEMATALKQMKEMGFQIPVLSVQAFDDPEIVNRAGDAAEGVVFSVPKPPDVSNPVVKNFRSDYAKTYRTEPGVCSDTGYDAVRIIAWAFEQGASTGPEIQQKLTQLKDFPGAAGSTTFDENGDVSRDFIFKVIKSGKATPR